MKRRKAIKNIGIGVAACYTAPSLLSSCDDIDGTPFSVLYDEKVVVIGAGISGLYAASILRNAGVYVEVLEASNQWGGRIQSLDNQTSRFNLLLDQELPIELGAEVMYGSNAPFTEIMKNMGINMLELDVDKFSTYVLDKKVALASEWASDLDFQRVQNFLQELPRLSGQSLTVNEAISGLTTRFEPLLISQAGNFYGSTNETIGAGGIGEALLLRSYDDKIMAMGDAPMQNFVTSRFYRLQGSVSVNAPVTSVEYGGDTVLIRVKNKEMPIETDKVIVTVPISILKSNDITFNPALPSTNVSAMGKIGMDECVRVLLGFSGNFWGENTPFIWGIQNAPYCYAVGAAKQKDHNVLSITIYGPNARRLYALGADNMIKIILDELDEIYDGNATKLVNKDFNTGQVLSVVKNWTDEPYIKGGFSYPLRNASIQDRVDIGAPVDDKVFFAGEATDLSGYAGTINGAVASAERVAKEVLDSIKSNN